MTNSTLCRPSRSVPKNLPTYAIRVILHLSRCHLLEFHSIWDAMQSAGIFLLLFTSSYFYNVCLFFFHRYSFALLWTLLPSIHSTCIFYKLCVSVLWQQAIVPVTLSGYLWERKKNPIWPLYKSINICSDELARNKAIKLIEKHLSWKCVGCFFFLSGCLRRL